LAEHAISCSQCGAPLQPSRFAHVAHCSHCGGTTFLDEDTVSAAPFREALVEWNSPLKHGFTSWLTLAGSHWSPGRRLATGDFSDVYEIRRARRPSENAILKVLRSKNDRARFDREWDALDQFWKALQESPDPTRARFPTLALRGEVTYGPYSGRNAAIYRHPNGRFFSADRLRRALPAGISPRSSIWVWRRLLESLSLMHALGMAHGAVLLRHILIETGEHGARLIGFNCLGRFGTELKPITEGDRDYYPANCDQLSAATDVVASARCMSQLLGGRADGSRMADHVPPALRELVERTAKSNSNRIDGVTAWNLRERLGELARATFGAPMFCPIAPPQ